MTILNPKKLPRVEGRATQGASRPRNVRVSPRLEGLEERVLLTAGDLDPTFGIGGRVASEAAITGGVVVATALQRDGRIVVVGTAATRGGDFLVERFTPAGSPDTAFGDADPLHPGQRTGSTTTDFGRGRYDAASSVVIEPGGKIVVGGLSFVSDTSYDFALARYNADGSLDDGSASDSTPGDRFGTAGTVTTNLGNSKNAIAQLALQTDGMIVAGGIDQNGLDGDFAIARYRQDGSLDPTFGRVIDPGTGERSGKVNTDFGNSHEGISGIAIQSDGFIVACGGTGPAGGGDPKIGLARYDTHGDPDASFGSDGKLARHVPNSTGEAPSGKLALQPDDKILVTGSCLSVGGLHSAFLARFDADGRIDDSFGSGGASIQGFGLGENFLFDAAVQADGSIVAVGTTGPSGQGYDFVVARWSRDGVIDPVFRDGGKQTTDFSGRDDTGQGVVIQPDKRILVVGLVNGTGGLNTGSNIGIARYLGDAVNRPPVAVDDTAIAASGSPFTIHALSNDFDADGDAMIIALISQPPAGTGSVAVDDNGTPNNPSDDSLIFTPDPHFGQGVYRFTYKVSDGKLDSNVATVTVTPRIAWMNRGGPLEDGGSGEDSDSFNARYGANASLARGIVDRAVRDWSSVVLSFNYATQRPFSLRLSADNFGFSTNLAFTTGIISEPESEKPVGATIMMDDNAAGFGWYFDSSPTDDAEFTSLSSPYSASAPLLRQYPFDFYQTVAHELGHALGLAFDTNLNLNSTDFLTLSGTDQIVHSARLFVFRGSFQGEAVTATFTTDGGAHLYEGPPDPSYPNTPSDKDDLMNSGRTLSFFYSIRRLISDLDAKILGAAYSYTIRLPSTLNTFLSNLDSRTGVLTVNGSPGTNNTILIDEASRLRVRVNGFEESFAPSQVTSVRILPGSGSDLVDASSLSRAISIDGGPGNDTLRGGSGDDVLDGGTGIDYVYGNGGDDILSGGLDFDPDFLYGGAGRDLFVMRDGDLVLDFSTTDDYPLGTRERDRKRR